MQEKPLSDISYNQFLNEEKLMGAKCKKCGAIFTPPRAICRNCHSRDLEWTPMKGEGKLAAFTCIAIGPPFMIAEGYNRENPYCTGVIEMEEGPKICARIEGVNPGKPDSIKIGTPLTVKFLHRGEGEKSKTYLAFEPQ